MNPFLLGAAVAIALTFGPASQAQTAPTKLDPVVEATLASGFQGDIPVIVRFAGGADLKEVRKAIKAALKDQYPDPKERQSARKALKRSMLLDMLKDQAKAGKQAVSDYLVLNDEAAEVTELWIINAIAVELRADLVAGLADLPGIESIVLDATVQGPGTGTAPTAPTYWNLDKTGVSALWSQGHTGLGVVVATLDAGVDATHPDLGPRWRGGSNSWFDPYGQHATPADSTGHGTQVLGLIVGGAAGGYQVGMAPEAQWIAAKIFDNSNQATLSGIHQAYQWVLDPDGNPATDDAPDIVNNSWALNGSQNQCVQEFAQDVALLKEAEIAVVFSGGNYGPDPGSSVSPSNDPAVLSVGAVDYYDNVDLMSSRGPNACTGGTYPTLTAPGDGVLTTDRMPGFYNIVAGTSFAVAHLAGGMAVLRSAFPDATVTQLETAVVSTAADRGTAGPDNDYGEGMLDLVAAHDWLAAAVGGGTGGGGTGNPGTLQLDAVTYSLAENVASLTVTVTRAGGSSGDVSVAYATADDTATAAEDYVQATDTLTLLDGETSGTFDIALLDDTTYEGDETFTVSLSSPQGATLGTPQSAMVTILEDDPDPSTIDTDGDGIVDSLDQCPGTPTGVAVDQTGCALSPPDDDGDGVPNADDACPNTPPGTTVDPNGCPSGPVDADGDGFAADVDCNDADASVYPGAREIKRDGIDQDCNGYDLTINVTRSAYSSSRERLTVYADSDLGSAASLGMVVTESDGSTTVDSMSWNRRRGRWEATVRQALSLPATVTVTGPEGSVSAPVD